MLTHQWSLVLFTILVQTAVGMLLVSEIVRFSFGSVSDRTLTWQAPTVVLLSGGGLLVSLTHLGAPTHSVFTILNLGHSWLSREILATGGFFLAVLLLVVARRKRPANKAGLISAIAVLFGLASVLVMSMVYLLRTVPVWNSMSTVLSFLGTMLLTGAAASGLIFSVQAGSIQADPAVRGTFGRVVAVFSVAVALGLALKFVSIPMDMIALNATDELGVSGLGLLTSGGLGLLILRLLLVFAGTALFGWMTIKALAADDPRTLVSLSLCALCCVLAGEVLGRLMFYGTYLRIGL